jgi:hypothetical protein
MVNAQAERSTEKELCMSRTRYTLMTLALAFFPMGCVPMGCAAEDPGIDDSAEEQFEGAKPEALAPPVPGKPSLYGTWKGDTYHISQLETLALMTDGRYHGARNVACVQAPCPPIGEDGTFAVYSRDTKKFIELVARGTGHTDRYEYGFTDNTLRLRPLRPGSEWRSMMRTDNAWCSGARDCTMQNLLPGPCSGSFTCTRNECAWTCAHGEEESEALGGVRP